MESAESLLNKNAKSVAPSITEALKSRATTAGWPEDIVSKLSVSDNLTLNGSPELKEKIYNLEFGEPPFFKPTSVLRNVFDYNNDDLISEVFTPQLIDRMIEETGALDG